MMKVLIINGPNLNIVGRRESVYGTKSIEQINEEIIREAEKMDIEVEFFQSNHEGELIDKIQEAEGNFDALIINPGGLTHYSVSLRDALSSFKGRKVEVHLTNIFSREIYRRTTITGEAVDVVIAGAQELSYILALIYLKGDLDG